jgi:hypothetical protein
MFNRVWLWIVAGFAAVGGVLLLMLTGQRKHPPILPMEPPARPDTPPVDKPLVTLRPADDYGANKTPPATGPGAPSAVITRINTRHGGDA